MLKTTLILLLIAFVAIVYTQSEATSNILKACAEGNKEIVEEAIKTDPTNFLTDFKDSEEQNCVHHAALNSQKNILKILIFKKKMNPNLQDRNGNTALNLAITSLKSEKEVEQVVTAFLELGADPNIPDNNGFTPLHNSILKTYHQVTMLLAKSVDVLVNAQAKNGRTPLHLLAHNKPTVEVVRTLFRHGADVTIPDNKGKLAVDLVNPLNHADIVKLLKSRENIEITKIKEWSVEDVGTWLTTLKGIDQNLLNDYIKIFQKNGIAGRELFKLTEETLKTDLKIKSFGDRYTILTGVSERNSKDQTLVEKTISTATSLDWKGLGALFTTVGTILGGLWALLVKSKNYLKRKPKDQKTD